ncbi:MAG: Hsp20/alpha crystallin family protein [Nitrospirae bacterium]|nr:Hsp20/alpha crystallin family protein [Nitrospirota bacterium]
MTRKDIFDEMDDLHWEMERLFHSLFNPKHPFHLLADRHWKPLTDVYEISDDVIIKVEIPGVEKKDISITLEGKQLLIRGARTNPHQKSCITYHQMEINYGDFERTIMLPEAYDADRIAAELKEGFLYIRIKKNSKSCEGEQP